ncbi:hypothetical protein BDN70DRAFT_922818 [Pholiota conissans]|uniref:F-box domain-containing protein n=1 Tax=Pholiota conissans TaxID=109636 RepID=A0A9P5YZ06_9AGAR|nr:hypothetical protein BDN70DRAFT_922818 [Pholiota conissans]
MDFPDDIWLEIFKFIAPKQLATDIRLTCVRFNQLSIGPRFRHILWLTPVQIDRNSGLWPTDSSRASLAEVLRVGPMHPGIRLYDSIHARMLCLIRLHTLTIAHIPYSKDTFRVLERLPMLRNLRIIDSLYWTPRDFILTELVTRPPQPPMQLPVLPITHLRLQNMSFFNRETPEKSHPLRLLTCPNLKSLAITWDPFVGMAYQLNVHDPLGKNPRAAGNSVATSIYPRPSSSLRSVEVHIPNLSPPFFEGLISLASSPMLRVKIRIEKSVLLKAEIAELASSLRAARYDVTADSTHFRDGSFPSGIRGIWSYTGPLDVLDVFVSPGNNSEMHGIGHEVLELSIDSDASRETPLTHLHLLSSGDTLSDLISRISRLREPLLLQSLDISVFTLDVEIFFAACALLGNLEKLVVRYRYGEVDEDLVITLGSSILPNLKYLRTLRVFCLSKQPAHLPKNINIDSYLMDYILAWSRFNPSLRRVQLGGMGSAWWKRWDTDKWRRAWVEDVHGGEDVYGGDSSDLTWTDESSDLDEVWTELDTT